MKLRAYSIVADAVERATDGALPYAVRRWFKYREDSPPALLDDRAFLEHVAEHARNAVMDALADVIDFDSDDGEELPVKAPSIVVYHGGGGWRWMLTDGEPPHRALSPYFPSRQEAVDDAQGIARATGLALRIEPEEPSSTP